MATVKLQSYDGEIFIVELAVAQCSGVIRTMLEDLDNIDGVVDDCIPLPNVDGKTLGKIITWANHQVDRNDGDQSQLEWETNFLTIGQAELLKLINAANYLDIEGLLELTCKAMANMLKGKTPDQLRTLFNV